ncbi:MAG TPA: TadE/TadG family type IV pilus assembly protein [Rhodopila sp.]|nr:TadE/TadG family type IV pilus assembly protein [Rhodopila sp.]
MTWLRLLPYPRRAGRRGLGCDRSALAALEFALTAPILSVLFIGSVDAAQVFIAELQLTSAIYSGANYAIVNQANVSSTAGATLASSIATIVGNVNGSGWASGTIVVNNGPTVTFSGGANTASGTATNADSFYCLTGSPGEWSWGTGQTNNTASCGASQPSPGKFVTITASYAVKPIILGLNFGDGQISQSVAVQVQ